MVGWLALHVYLSLYWCARGDGWIGGVFAFCVVFDLVDYHRELTLGRHRLDADEVRQ